MKQKGKGTAKRMRTRTELLVRSACEHTSISTKSSNSIYDYESMYDLFFSCIIHGRRLHRFARQRRVRKLAKAVSEGRRWKRTRPRPPFNNCFPRFFVRTEEIQSSAGFLYRVFKSNTYFSSHKMKNELP